MSARVDLFGPIHKAIRFAMCEVLARLGATSFADDRAAAATLAELESVLAFCERHGEYEDAFLRPALAGRGVEVFDDGHARLHRLVAEVRALASAIAKAPREKRDLAGRTLYVHVSGWVADNLAHMAEEEQVLQPLFEWMHGESELRAIQGRLSAALSPAERVESATWMLRASSPPERAALVNAFIAMTSREAVLGMLESVRPRLAPADWADLSERCALSA